MTKHCAVVLGVFMLLAGQISWAQKATLTGKLVDENDVPVEYGSIAIYQSGDSTLVDGSVTDTSGKFTIIKLPAGNFYLVAKFVGYKSSIVSDILLSEKQHLDIGSVALSTDSRLMQELVVEGEKANTMHQIDKQVYDATQYLSSQGGTATDVLRNMPSIAVNAQGEIAVRGTTGFIVLLNGKPIQTQPSVILNQLPANSIENIELITAPSAKYDPEGKAGIINIITKTGSADGIFMQVNAKAGLPSLQDYDNAEYAQRYGADVTVNYRKNKWDLSFGAGYLRNDISGRREGDVYTITNDTLTRFPSDGERSFDEVNFSGRFTVNYKPNPRNSYSLGFYAGKRSKDRTADILYYDNHAIDQESGNRSYTFQYYNENLRIRRGDFVLGSFDYAHTFKDQSSMTSSVLYEYTMLGGPTTNRNLGWPDTDLVYQDEYNTNDNPLSGFRFQTDYTSKPLPFGRIDAGYQYRILDHTGDFVYERKNNETGIFELVPAFSSNVDLLRKIHAGYAQLSGEKGKWSYGAGLRVELMDRTLDLKDKAGTVDTTYLYDFVKPYPSANVMYVASESLRFKAAYSKRVERTTTFKMNPFPEREHSETLEQGDPTLLPEFIDLVEIGFVKDFGQQSVFANAYFRHVENLVNRVNTVYNDTILNRIYSNVGIGQSTGFEIGADLQPTSWWQVFAGGNIYHYEIDGTFDDRPVNTKSWVYTINANTTFTLSPTANLQWTLNYISDRNTAQGEDSRYFSPNLTFQKTFLDDRLTATVQWLNMDVGLLNTNEQRITTWREGEFYTTTNYVYEVDMIMLNIGYVINKTANKAKFIKSEFGEKEF